MKRSVDVKPSVSYLKSEFGFSWEGIRHRLQVLPARLLEELQEYIAGELVYIPKKEESRKGWGEVNGTRQAIRRRNEEIRRLHRAGETVQTLAEKYHLSEDSIRKIVFCKEARAGSHHA